MAMGMFVIGCIAVMAGAAMVAFGIPVSEFSFGNTLIVSGATLATGGIIVIALSAVVKELQRIVDGVAGRALASQLPHTESFQPPPENRAVAGRAPFPSKSKTREPSQSAAPEPPPIPADLDAESHHEPSFAPSMRNPEAPAVTVEDDISLSPLPPEAGEGRREPSADTPWHNAPPPRETPSSYFDSLWPAKPRTTPANEQRGGAKPGEPSRDNGARAPAQPPASEPGATPRSPVAILKSGVVDGMGYTLYVDGSIEAELPQGTLRFASIDELRAHLDKNG